MIFRIIKCIFSELNMNKKMFIKNHIYLLLIMTIYVLSSTLYPSFIHKIIDDGLSKKRIDIALINCVYMIICGVIMLISEFFYGYKAEKFFVITSNYLKLNLFKRFFCYYSSDLNDRVGEINTVITNDISDISAFFTDNLTTFLKNIFMVIGVSGYMAFFFKTQAIALVLLSVFMVVSQKILGQKIQKASELSREAIGEESSLIYEYLNNAEEIRLSGNTDFILNKVSEANEDVINSRVGRSYIVSLTQLVGHTINVALVLIVIFIGVFGVWNSKMEIGMMFSMTIYAQRLINPISGIISIYVSIQGIRPAFDRVYKFIKKTMNRFDKGIMLDEDIYHVEYSNVTLSYDCEHNIIENFNLTILKGQKIAFVGKNGSGKTSLAKTLFNPNAMRSGSIIINEKFGVFEIQREYFFSRIGYLSQEVSLISGKVIDIVNPYEKNVSEEKIKKLLMELGFDLVCINYDLNYEIEENSANISGGEKQKLALARVIIEDKKFLILDEPTSAMDTESENKVYNYLTHKWKDKTCIIITHREKMLEMCDMVVKLC